MIIGNGLIASAFKEAFSKSADILIFASGVSNSQESNPENFYREKKLLLETIREEKLFIYFSTCSLNDESVKNSPYGLHKQSMESIVKLCDRFIIFRLPQVVGQSKNQSTLTNYLYKVISNNMRFSLWQYAYRNLIDIDDVTSIANELIRNPLNYGSTINIANRLMISMPNLVEIFEIVLNKKAKYDPINISSNFKVDTELSDNIALNLGINFDNQYIQRIITKYYIQGLNKN